MGVHIETIALGLCASAATFLLLGGSKKMMGKNAYLMIHQISDSMGGYYNALKDEMRTNKKLMKHCKELYTEYTTLPEELLETLFSKDTIMSSKKCLKYGIVDSVI
jgi:ATP-dependent protease ClpP protease subunit